MEDMKQLVTVLYAMIIYQKTNSTINSQLKQKNYEI